MYKEWTDAAIFHSLLTSNSLLIRSIRKMQKFYKTINHEYLTISYEYLTINYL
jgi:hypothetical protein